MEETPGHRPVPDAGAGRPSDGRADQPLGCRRHPMAGTIATGRSPRLSRCEPRSTFSGSRDIANDRTESRLSHRGVRSQGQLQRLSGTAGCRAARPSQLRSIIGQSCPPRSGVAPARPQSPHDESQIADRLSRPLDRGTEQRRRSERPRHSGHQFHRIGTQVETVGRGRATLQIARRAADREGSRSPARARTAAWAAGPEWKREEHTSETGGRHTGAGLRHHHPRG